jgi:hypothetical protein
MTNLINECEDIVILIKDILKSLKIKRNMFNKYNVVLESDRINLRLRFIVRFR